MKENLNLIQKDVYVTSRTKEKLIAFLCDKTGMEWYLFRRTADICTTLKDYIIETIECYSESYICFDDLEDYQESIENCFLTKVKNERLPFFFTKEESQLLSDFCCKNNFQQETAVLQTIMLSLINHNKKYKVRLDDFAKFFLTKNYKTILSIPSEIINKINRLENPIFKKNYNLFLKHAIFWQIHFGETPILNTLKDEEYYKVTPQKINWIRVGFSCGMEVKKFIQTKKYGSTATVSLLNAINSYADYAISQLQESVE